MGFLIFLENVRRMRPINLIANVWGILPRKKKDKKTKERSPLQLLFHCFGTKHTSSPNIKHQTFKWKFFNNSIIIDTVNTKINRLSYKYPLMSFKEH